MLEIVIAFVVFVPALFFVFLMAAEKKEEVSCRGILKNWQEDSDD